MPTLDCALIESCRSEFKVTMMCRVLVVSRSGIPGEGFSAEELEDYHQRREDVFNLSWFKLVPPSVENFQDARDNARQISFTGLIYACGLFAKLCVKGSYG